MIGILSDGQPGAGRAAVNAARLVGLPSKTGTISHNVAVAHATVLFISGRAKDHEDCDEVRAACSSAGKPMLEILVWAIPDAVPPTARLAGLIGARGFKVVNIAGSRGSSDPPIDGRPGSGIEAWVESYLIDVFTLLKEYP